jgi:hypothetical protein
MCTLNRFSVPKCFLQVGHVLPNPDERTFGRFGRFTDEVFFNGGTFFLTILHYKKRFRIDNKS